MAQRISSAGTCLKQVPAVFRLIEQYLDHPDRFWALQHDCLDIGGGRYDLLSQKLAGVGVRNWVLDPFNRPPEHNRFVRAMLKARPADMAICSNVLNVVREPEARLSIYRAIRRLTKSDGLVFFTVYEGNRSSRGKESSKGWQANRPTKSYLRELRRNYKRVRLLSNKLIVCEGFK